MVLEACPGTTTGLWVAVVVNWYSRVCPLLVKTEIWVPGANSWPKDTGRPAAVIGTTALLPIRDDGTDGLEEWSSGNPRTAPVEPQETSGDVSD